MPLKNRFPAIMASLEPSVNAAVRVGVETIEQSAKERVHVRTGALRDRIHTEPGDGGYYVVAGDENTFWGHLEEHGTSHSAPHPFLVPALEENRDTIMGLAAAAVRRL